MDDLVMIAIQRTPQEHHRGALKKLSAGEAGRAPAQAAVALGS